MNNVPADVVKAMGASRVVAINVGDLADLKKVDYSMVGLAGETLDALMRANTRTGISQADVIINVPLEDYGSLDWRKSAELIKEGYDAAESMRDSLLPLAVGEAEYARWKAQRMTRRRIALPPPAFVRVDGFSDSDARRLTGVLARHVGAAFDVDGGRARPDGAVGPRSLRVHHLAHRRQRRRRERPARGGARQAEQSAHPDAGPQPREHDVAGFQGDVHHAVSRLRPRRIRLRTPHRRDGRIGSRASARNCTSRSARARSSWRLTWALRRRTADFIADDAIVARYGQTSSRAGADLGVNLGPMSDLRGGAYIGRLDSSAEIGDPGLPRIEGKETAATVRWRYNSQDSAVVPSRGIAAYTDFQHIFDSPPVTPPLAEPAIERRPDAVVWRDDRVQEPGRPPAGVRPRRRRHVVHGQALADRSIHAGVTVSSRVLQQRGDSRRLLLRADRRLSSTVRPAARLPGRRHPRGRLDRER